MYIRYRTVKAFSELVHRIHTVPPWMDPKGFFDALQQVIPHDWSVASARFDPGPGVCLRFPTPYPTAAVTMPR